MKLCSLFLRGDINFIKILDKQRKINYNEKALGIWLSW